MSQSRHRGDHETPDFSKGKPGKFKNNKMFANNSSDVKIEDSNQKLSSNGSLGDGQTRLVRLIESKYLISQMRYYIFPGHQVNDDDSSSSSIESIKNAGSYNLHSQNRSKKAKKGHDQISQLDLTKLLKRRALAINSDRDNRLTKLEIDNNCPTSRNKIVQSAAEKKQSYVKNVEKNAKNDFLKTFLKRINLSKDRDVRNYGTKKQNIVSMKMKPPSSPPIKEIAALSKSKQGESITGRLSVKVLQPPQDTTRRNQLLRYLKDCQNSVEKLNSKVIKNKTHRPGMSSGLPTSSAKVNNKAAFSSLVIDQPLAITKTKLITNKPFKKIKSSSESIKNRPFREGKKSMTYVEPSYRSTKSFRREHSMKDSSHREDTVKNIKAKAEQKAPILAKGTSQKDFGSKFAGITKLVINTHRAYLHFDDKPLSDRRHGTKKSNL